MSPMQLGGVGIFLEAHVPAFVLSAGLLLVSACRLAAQHPSRRDRVLALGIWASALIVGYTQVLSLVRQLHWPAMMMLTGLGAVAARLIPNTCSLSKGVAPAPAGDAKKPGSTRKGGNVDRLALWVLAAPLAGYGLVAASLVAASAETCGDNATYHLPRLGYWLQYQSVAPFVANDPRIGTFPPNGNILQLFPLLFLRNEGLSALVQLAGLFATGLAVFGIARDLGASRGASALAAFCWFTIPSALGQATVSNVDLVASFFTVAAAGFGVSSRCLAGWPRTLTCLAASALALGTKPQTAIAVVPIGAWRLLGQWRRSRSSVARWLPAIALGGVLVGGLGYLQSWARFGSIAGFPAVESLVVNPGLTTLVKNARLLAMPIMPWGELVGVDSNVHPWSLAGALAGPGLGLLWLVAAGLGLAHLAWRVARRWSDTERLWTGYMALAVVFLIAVLFTMRHQPSVVRFALPAAALLSPVAALAFDDWLGPTWPRLAVTLLASALGSIVMGRAAWQDLIPRLAAPGYRCLQQRGLRPDCLVFKSTMEMCGPTFRPLARAAERLALRGPGRRLGVITEETFPQRLFFGARYANVVIPLSYDPPLDAASLDRLGLDALWIDGTGETALARFRHPFVKPRSRSSESWRMSTPASYDADFLEAYRLAVEDVSFQHLVTSLAQPASGWEALPWSQVGVLFTRTESMDDRPRVVLLDSANGFDELEGQPFFWLGSAPVSVTILATRTGAAVLAARFLPGPSLPERPTRRLLLSGSFGAQEMEVSAGARQFPIVLRSGMNTVQLEALDRPSAASPGDTRTLLLGVQGLAVSWREDRADVRVVVPRSSQATAYGFGFFQPERDAAGRTWRWMGRSGQVRLKNVEGDAILRIVGIAPVDQAFFELDINGEKLDEFVASMGPLDKRYTVPAIMQGAGPWSELRIRTSDTLVGGRDPRHLGLLVFGITWEPR